MADVNVSTEEEQIVPAPENDAEQPERANDALPGVVPAGEPSVAPEQAPEPAPPAGPKRYWFVVHCYSGYEKKVEKGLKQRIASMGMQDQIFRVIVPTEEEIDVREGQRKVIQRRVFPGYIMVEMLMSEESWYVVRNTPGVTGFVSSGDKPSPPPRRRSREDLEANGIGTTQSPRHVQNGTGGPYYRWAVRGLSRHG